MPAYAYPITIDRNKKTFQDTKTVRLDDKPLTIEKLAKVVGTNKFSIEPIGWELGGGYEVSINVTRVETDKQLANRVAKEEKYMAEYNRRHGA
jgi:hypothetical protein